MNDAVTTTKKKSFAFTEDGCRTEVRLGGLLVAASTFLWLFAGPDLCSKFYLVGAALLLVGIPIQAIQGRGGRPGYPWKMGLAMAVLGGAMLLDQRFREAPGGPIHVQDVSWMVAVPGVWILLWWPISRRAAAPEA